MSYYALFQWWLLLSQHPGCLSNPHPFSLNIYLGTLTGGLGCFPSTTDLITRSLTPEYKYMAFGVYLNSVTREGPLVQTVLYLHDSLPRG